MRMPDGMAVAADLGLQVERLDKAFAGGPVLRGVSLGVPRGRLVALLGASGSGKTTLLRLVCGFERADGGRIVVGGELVAGPRLHRAPERRRIGYVAQEGALFPHLSVAENVLFGLGRRQRRDLRHAEAMLERVGLPASHAARPPHALSGGEQQRVALARALAPGPRLVLLDEPFSALDAALRVETRAAVASALAASGATALLVTHDQSEALSMGHEVAVLRRGELVQVATPEALYRRPADAELARFVGEAVLLPGEALGGQVRCALGLLALHGTAAGRGGPVEVMLRPEQLQLGPPAAGEPGARVLDITYYGHDASVRLALEAPGSEVVLSARIHGHDCPAAGTRVGISVSGEVVAFPRG